MLAQQDECFQNSLAQVARGGDASPEVGSAQPPLEVSQVAFHFGRSFSIPLLRSKINLAAAGVVIANRQAIVARLLMLRILTYLTFTCMGRALFPHASEVPGYPPGGVSLSLLPDILRAVVGRDYPTSRLIH